MKRLIAIAMFSVSALSMPALAQEHEHEPAEHEIVAGEHAAGGEHGEAHVNYTEFGAMILNFLIWAAIIFFLLRKPLSSFLQSRRTAVVEGLEESKRLTEAAKQKYEEYSERLAHLDEELEKLRKEMIQAGEAERDRIIADAEVRAARMRKDAQFLIDQQMKQLRVDLTREAIEAAVGAAEQMLRAQTSATDQQKLADTYLADLASSLKKEDDEVRA